MNGDIEKRCGCVMGIRYICVKHCGGHGIPPRQDLQDGDGETAQELVESLVAAVSRDIPNITPLELIRFRQGAYSAIKVFILAADLGEEKLSV